MAIVRSEYGGKAIFEVGEEKKKVTLTFKTMHGLRLRVDNLVTRKWPEDVVCVSAVYYKKVMPKKKARK